MQLNQLLVDDSHGELADQKSLFSLPNKSCQYNFHDRLQVIANVAAPCSMKEQYQVSSCAQSVLRICFGLNFAQSSILLKFSSDVPRNALRQGRKVHYRKEKSIWKMSVCVPSCLSVK